MLIDLHEGLFESLEFVKRGHSELVLTNQSGFCAPHHR